MASVMSTCFASTRTCVWWHVDAGEMETGGFLGFAVEFQATGETLSQKPTWI